MFVHGVISSKIAVDVARAVWTAARDEIVTQSGKQFDLDVVDAFRDRESALQAVRRARVTVS